MKTTWILLCSLGVSVPAHGALLLDDVLQRMEQKQQTLTDATFDFVERIRQYDRAQKPITGKVQVQKPHHLRVDQMSPDVQRLITDGKTFWLYSPGAQQQITGSWTAWLKRSRFPLPILDFLGTFSSDTWRSRYKALFGGYDNHLYEVRFKPLDEKDAAVTLWISDEDFLPVRGRLEENRDTVMDVELSKVRTNTGMDPHVFVPKVPTGTPEIPMTF